MPNRRTLLLVLLLAAPLLAACGKAEVTPGAWSPVAEDALSATQKRQRKAAFDARDEVFTKLSGALQEAMRTKGPAAAIDVCRTQAPTLTAAVAASRHLAIGRTAQRLRNPANAPPAWAAALVAEGRAENAWLAHEDGRLAALLPIRLQNACLACHGAPEAIAEDVEAALATHYPDDRATGFAAGDLRGWFWVEVPPVQGYGDAR